MSLDSLPKDQFNTPNRSGSPILASLLSTNVAKGDGQSDRGVGGSPQPKRNACTLCRKRKLRCDGGYPSCRTCTRLNHDCTYVESRRKSGPRRGYVKNLETRLAQVEELLKRQDAVESNDTSSSVLHSEISSHNIQSQYPAFDLAYESNDLLMSSVEFFPSITEAQSQTHLFSQVAQNEGSEATPNDSDNGFSWAMIELGLDEPLPIPEITDELTEIYFTKVHPSCPMIHQSRFLVAMDLSPRTRPSVALRYAMWTLAACSTEKYKSLHSQLYVRARKYAELDELSGRQKYINVRHVQAWLLIGTYEFKFIHFPQSWLTISRATRLSQMMGLHRLDGLGLDVKQTLPVTTAWSEKEERRRTFWVAFCMDRYASIGTGWPMIVDERDIITNLPSTEEAFAQNEEVTGISLRDGMNPLNASCLSSFAGVVIIASLSGRTLEHLQRPSRDDDDKNMNGEFWKNHRKMDNILLNTSLCLPSHLRLPAGSPNANTIFLNMSLQAATICLHQAAIFKAEKVELATSISTESRMRCLTAATEICSIMKMLAHMDLHILNVYTPFCLYVAARVLALVAKSQPGDDSATSSVRFLLSALMAMKTAIPVAENFLVQLDLEGISLGTLEQVGLPSSDLEMNVANISIQDETDDSSWTKFISPLVRIVEQKEESISPPVTSPNAQVSPSGGNVTGGNVTTTLSSPSGSRIANSNSAYPEQQLNMADMPSFTHSFTELENWGLCESNVPAHTDSFMNMQPSSWDDSG